MATSPCKRASGGSKMEEIAHPVFRGVKRRGSSERWVSEVREPKRNMRIPLGTFLTAEMAARAYDVAVVALGIGLNALNFPDSKWLFALPRSYRTLKGLQVAAMEAAELFRPRDKANFVEDACSSTSSDTSTVENEVASFSSSSWDDSTQRTMLESTSDSQNSTKQETSSSFSSSEPVYDAMMFDLEKNGEMNILTYYASLAEGLLIEPPIERFGGSLEDECGIEATLWSS